MATPKSNRQSLEHVGKWADRNNAREVAFAHVWRNENRPRQALWLPGGWGCTLELLLGRQVTQAEAKDFATVIQWLGSDVGWSFLNGAVERCGYKIVKAKK